AVGVRHPDVEEHEVRPGACAHFARLRGIFRERHAVPLVREDLREELADADLVVDDQYVRHAGSAARGADGTAGHAAFSKGSEIDTVAPPGRPPASRFSIAMLPWCSSMIFFTMARPRPVPRGLVVT